MKKDINKATNIFLFIGIFLSVSFVLGILAIIFGANNNVALMVIGIIATVLGFYGTPLIWIKFGNLVSLRALYYSIVHDEIVTVKELSNNFNCDETAIINKISSLIAKRYLVGYVFKEKRVLELKEKVNNDIITRKCSNCGASLENYNHKLVCKYCNSEYSYK